MPDLYFLIFGMVVSLIGILSIFAKMRSIATCTEAITASVASIKTETTLIRGSTVYFYRPVYSYSYFGKKYKAEAPYKSMLKGKYNVGDTASIYINPAEPGDFRFPNTFAAFVFGIIALAVGLLFVVLYFY